ncbi:MAG: hypothetical protein ACUVWY_14970, partial [Desulfosoma sp.]|uniref:hypothetical protein n=1 Tax=Desulfosoma sp. TaxID=2603217 RepID=UPI004048ED16
AEGAERSAKASTEDSLRAEAVWEATENEIRYRVRNPDEFKPDSFRRKPLQGVDSVAIIKRIGVKKLDKRGNIL